MQIDDFTLRLHFSNREGVMNIDIHYNEPLDLYEIEAHRINPKTLAVTTRVYKDIYFSSSSGMPLKLVSPSVDEVTINLWISDHSESAFRPS